MVTEDKFILFLHLQKTAGMTLQELLRRCYGPGLVTRVVRRLSKKSPAGLPLEEALKRVLYTDRLFMGHFCYGVHRLLDFPVTYITFLRDPVSRLISLYNYSHTTPTAHYYSIARDMSLEEFLLESTLPETDNGITRFIAGDDHNLFINQTPCGACTRDLLEQAKDNLNRHFSFIGIQEEFDKSVLLLTRNLELKSPYYVTLNESRGKGYRTLAEPRLIEQIKQRNSLDMELYAWSLELFEKEFSRQFPEPEVALDEFRKKNAAYQRWARPAFKARLGLSSLAGKLNG